MALAAQILNLGTLTKKVAVILRDCTTSALLASVTLQYALLKYGAGSPGNADWMVLEQKGVVTTSPAGVFSVPYTGVSLVGDTIYIAILQPDPTPNETMLWTATVLSG